VWMIMTIFRYETQVSKVGYSRRERSSAPDDSTINIMERYTRSRALLLLWGKLVYISGNNTTPVLLAMYGGNSLAQETG